MTNKNNLKRVGMAVSSSFGKFAFCAALALAVLLPLSLFTSCEVNAGSSDPTISKIVVKTMPAKTSFTKDEKLDLSGLVVQAVYSDGSAKIITDYIVTPSENSLLSTVGTVEVTISYMKKSVSFSVEVTESGSGSGSGSGSEEKVEYTAIKIHTLPTKTEYTVGELFSTEGLSVYGVKKDRSEAEIFGWTTSPRAGLEFIESDVGTRTVIVTYNLSGGKGGGSSTSFDVVQDALSASVVSSRSDDEVKELTTSFKITVKEAEKIVSDSFFWGTWVRMDSGEQYEILESEVVYLGKGNTDSTGSGSRSVSKKSRTVTPSSVSVGTKYKITETSDTSLTVQELGTFTKQSDSVIKNGAIPYFRNGGTKLDYKLKIVGFSNSSRAVSTQGLKGLKGKGKSKTFTSFKSEGESDENGELHLTAPTANDTQTVTITLDDGGLMVIPDIMVANAGSNMGTVAVVDDDQANLKITGRISDEQKDDGYLYGNGVKSYRLELNLKNISEKNAYPKSFCSIKTQDPSLSLELISSPLNSTKLENLAIPRINAGAGLTEPIVLKVTYGYMTRDKPFVDTGIVVTLKSSKDDSEWEDFVPLRFFRGLIPITVSALNPVKNNTQKTYLNGFIIYPDGNNQFFSVPDKESQILFVPTFGKEKQYKLVFSGANAEMQLENSTEMYYSVAPGTSEVKIIDINNVTSTDDRFGGDNHTEDTAYDVEEAFIAYLDADETEGIDFYNITADSDEIYAPGAKSFRKVTYASQYGDAPSSFYIAEGQKIPSDKLPVLTAEGKYFCGWYVGSNEVTGGSYTVTGDVTLTAKWLKECKVTYSSAHGTAPSSIRIGEGEHLTRENLPDLTAEGYYFKGWYIGTDVVSAGYTVNDDLTITAKWANGYKITYDNCGHGIAPESITLEEGTSLKAEHLPELKEDGFKHRGWFTSSNCSDVSKVSAGYTLRNSITLYAKWDVYTGPNFTKTMKLLPAGTEGTAGTEATYVLFGDWPQTIKERGVTVDETTFEVHGAFTYYEGSDGYWYAKCEENASNTGYYYSDGNKVSQKSAGTTKYFKLEPIKWRLLTQNYNGTGTALLLAENILTGNVPYYLNGTTNNSRWINSSTIYHNNYKYSTIRAYLNGSYETDDTQTKTYENMGFLQTAFTSEAQELIATATVDNSAESAQDADENFTSTVYICENTSDKIFLLSMRECTTAAYGFENYNSSGEGNSRIRVPTDFAKANYCTYETTTGFGGYWWLRTPNKDSSVYVHIVNDLGKVNGDYSYREVSKDNFGIVPALTIPLDESSYVSVSFDSEYWNGESAAPVKLFAGNYLELNQLPQLKKFGYVFGGWYTDSACTDSNKVTERIKIDSDTTLYAKWTEKARSDDGLVYVEGGTIGGSDKYNPYDADGTTFQKGCTVTLSDFYISDHEVTQGEYEVYCGYDEESLGPDGKPFHLYYETGYSCPVYYVGTLNAIVYCNIKSMDDRLTPCYSYSGETDPTKWPCVKEENGKYSCSYSFSSEEAACIECDFSADGYRLPTVAEWEYAARGGKNTYGTEEFSYYFAGAGTTDYESWTNASLDNVGWYDNNSGNSVQHVKLKAPNALNLYDMSGNVSEMCWSSAFNTGIVTDPSSSSLYILNMGGDCTSRANKCTVYSPGGYPAGFRLVRSASKRVQDSDFVTVYFDTNGGNAVEPIQVTKGSYIHPAMLPIATKHGLKLDAWCTDSAGNTKLESRLKVDGVTTLYAKWKEIDDGFVQVKGGIIVGSDDYNQRRSSGEKYSGAFPAGRTVALSDFYICDHEVTQGEFEELCYYTESKYTPGSSEGMGSDYPAYYINWYNAVLYCNLKSIKEGLTPCYSISGVTDPKEWSGVRGNIQYACTLKSTDSDWDNITCDFSADGYRLPTEAEWEYAARGGHVTYGTDAFANYFSGASTTDYESDTNSELATVGWYRGNSASSTHEVCQKTKNELNLFDMSGNVSELCWDLYGTITANETVIDPTGTSSDSYRVIRGGSRVDYPYECSVSYRDFVSPYSRTNEYGFRLVRSATKRLSSSDFVELSFDAGEGFSLESVYLPAGSYFLSSMLPSGLRKFGHVIEGWYTDSACTASNKVVDRLKIEDRTTLYAKWKEVDDGFVFVEGGTVVGSANYNQQYSGAFPAGRTVALNDFYICDHELTQGEYEELCCYTSSSPSSDFGVGADYPVYYVNWYDAIVYCNLKSMKEGLTPCYALSGVTDPKMWTGIKKSGLKYSCSYTSNNSNWNSITCDFTADGYRLPTEAEWEYAARGGKLTYGTDAFAYYFSGANTTKYNVDYNSDLDSVGWYSYNVCNNGVTGSTAAWSKTQEGYGTHEVKQKQHNALGLYDMTGNVCEWCYDWNGTISTSETVTDPSGDSSGSKRVVRGGAWNSFAWQCSVSSRLYSDDPYNRDYTRGFRLVRSAERTADLDFVSVNFVSEHGSSPDSIQVTKGSYIHPFMLSELKSYLYIFDGWYTDENYADSTKITERVTINSETTLFAKWEKDTVIHDGFVFVEGGTVVGKNAYNQKYTGAFPEGRKVTLSDFYMSDHELTQGEYEELCCYGSSVPTSTYGCGENYPVYLVSWYDAVVYCNLKSIKEGLTPCYALSGVTDPRQWEGIKTKVSRYSCSYTSSNSAWDNITCNLSAGGYRLPTEAEWEYAARGGKKTYGTDAFANYFAGVSTSDYEAEKNSDLDDYAWYRSNSNERIHEGKGKKKNALGLYDMSGNVCELCNDLYGTISTTETVTDPSGPTSGSSRVVRGGYYLGYAYYSSVSYRGTEETSSRGYTFGLRLIRTAASR